MLDYTVLIYWSTSLKYPYQRWSDYNTITQMYSSTSTITLECNHDYFQQYFNEYLFSNIKMSFFSVAVSLSSVLTGYCYPGVIIIDQTNFTGIE